MDLHVNIFSTLMDLAKKNCLDQILQIEDEIYKSNKKNAFIKLGNFLKQNSKNINQLDMIRLIVLYVILHGKSY